MKNLSGVKQNNLTFQYDVFISYSHKNGDWVFSKLLPRLKSEDLRVCIDKESFMPGRPIIEEMEKGVLESRKTLLVLSPDYIESEWCNFEDILSETIDLNAHRKRIIPVLLDKCKIPRRIKMRVCIDFTKEEEIDFKFKRLISAIKEEGLPDLSLLIDTNGCMSTSTRYSSIKPPGGPINPDAINFIHRSSNKSILTKFKEGMPFWINIVGPPQSGKSSLMAYAAKLASEREIKICNLDLRGMRDSIEFGNYDKFLRNILIRLRWVTDENIIIDQNEIVDNLVIQNEIEKAVNNQRNGLLLLIDSVDFLYRYFSKEEINNFLNLIAGWHDLQNKKPLTLGVITALTPAIAQMNITSHSPILYRGELLSIDFFNKKDVKNLASKLGINKKNDWVTAWNLFNGQPYLTHLFLEELHQGKNIEKIKNEILMLRGGAEKHHEHIKLEIIHDPFLNSNLHLWKLFTSNIDNIDNIINRDDIMIKNKLQERGYFLERIKALHIVDKIGDHYEVLGEFYKKCIPEISLEKKEKME